MCDLTGRQRVPTALCGHWLLLFWGQRQDTNGNEWRDATVIKLSTVPKTVLKLEQVLNTELRSNLSFIFKPSNTCRWADWCPTYGRCTALQKVTQPCKARGKSMVKKFICASLIRGKTSAAFPAVSALRPQGILPALLWCGFLDEYLTRAAVLALPSGSVPPQVSNSNPKQTLSFILPYILLSSLSIWHLWATPTETWSFSREKLSSCPPHWCSSQLLTCLWTAFPLNTFHLQRKSSYPAGISWFLRKNILQLFAMWLC